MTLTETENRVVVLKTNMRLNDESIAHSLSKPINEIKQIISGIIKKLRETSTPDWIICKILNINQEEIQIYISSTLYIMPTAREIALESKITYLEYKIACMEEQLRYHSGRF